MKLVEEIPLPQTYLTKKLSVMKDKPSLRQFTTVSRKDLASVYVLTSPHGWPSRNPAEIV